MTVTTQRPPDQGHHRVLVVEDDPKLARLLVRALAEAGMPADAALTGEDALARASAEGYAAVVLDLMLPGIDGLEVCRAMRGRGFTAPVVILTARWDLDERASGVRAGADDFFPKPFSLEELTGRLRELVAAARTPGSDPAHR
jgi:DNA-binding response OmpR family regulator